MSERADAFYGPHTGPDAERILGSYARMLEAGHADDDLPQDVRDCIAAELRHIAAEVYGSAFPPAAELAGWAIHYRGGGSGLAATFGSAAFAVRFSGPGRFLTDAEIETVCRRTAEILENVGVR